MPIITNIEQQRRNKNRYSIYLDKEFAFGVSEDVLIKERLSVGKEVNEEYIKNVLEFVLWFFLFSLLWPL